MSGMAWYLEVLGLPPYAELSAVRKAYAQALRKIDQTSDPEAFARLREAYEAARAWCEQREDTAPPVEAAPRKNVEPSPPLPANRTEAPPARGTTEQVEAEDETDSPPADPRADARREAALLMDSFIASVQRSNASEAADMLDHTVAALRQRYIDAPGELEERLVDLLSSQQIPHRSLLFEAALGLFHWEDIGQLTALGRRGQWIEKVLGQRGAWLELSASRRTQWLELIRRAKRPIDPSLIRYWPEIARLCEQYPLWIGLHLDHGTGQAWKAAFDNLPLPVQRNLKQSSATPGAFKPVRQKQGKRPRKHIRRWLGWIALLWILLQILKLATTPTQSDASPDTIRVERTACAELYRRLSQPDAFAGLSSETISELSSSGSRCEKQGYWPRFQPDRR